MVGYGVWYSGNYTLVNDVEPGLWDRNGFKVEVIVLQLEVICSLFTSTPMCSCKTLNQTVYVKLF